MKLIKKHEAKEPDSNEAHQRLLRLNQLLLNCDSATFALDAWCTEYGSQTSGVYAERLADETEVIDSQVIALLQVSEGEALAYRRVYLMWGGVVLAEAENWYRLQILNSTMKRRLDHTSIAFGRAVESLNFRRKLLSAELLWPCGESPLPKNVLRHSAILETGAGVPFSLVKETYCNSVLFI